MIWTLLGVVGMSIGWVNLKKSKANIDSVREMNGHNLKQYRILRVIAYGHYRNDLFRFAKHTTITAMGVIAMILPAQNPPTHGVTPTAIVITGGLFTIVILLLMASLLDRRQREAMEEMNGH